MDSLSGLASLIIYPFKNIFLYHKKKLVFFTLCLLLFLVTLFPFSDLTYFSQQKINQSLGPRGGQVSFSKIFFNFIPLGVKTSDFVFSSPQLKNNLEIKDVVLKPNIFSLLKFQPGGSLNLEGFFNGDLDADLSLTGKTNEGKRKFSFGLELSRIALEELLKFQNIALPINGSLHGRLNAAGEESFRQQPKGNFKFNLKNVVIPAELSLPIGTIPLPSPIRWENSNIFADFQDGRILFKDGTLGTKEAPVNGRYKGYLTCLFSKSGNNVNASCSDYDLQIELEVNRDFQRSFAQDLSALIKPSQVNQVSLSGGGMKYLFGIKGNAANRFSTPRLYSLSSF